MAEGTTYQTGVEYTLKDTASKAMDHLHARAEKLSEGFKDSAKEMAAMGLGALGLGYGLHALAEKVIETNTEFGEAKKTMAGALFAFQSWKTGVAPIDAIKQSMSDASEMAERFEKVKYRLAKPLPELTQAFQGLAGPAFERLGKSREQVAELVEHAAEAASVFRMSTTDVAYSMTRILETGRIPARALDPFNVSMRHMLGNIKGVSREKIFEKMEKSMARMGPAADEMAKGFGPTMFRLKEFVSDTVRDLGGPTFKYVGQEIAAWSTRLSAATKDGRSLVQVYGDKLLSGFKMLQSITGTLLDNWKEIAAIWGGMKLAGGISGLTGSMNGSLTNFAGKLSVAAGGLTLLYNAAQTFADWLDKKQTNDLQEGGKAAGTHQALMSLWGGNMQGARGVMKSYGLVSDGKLNQAALSKLLQSDPDTLGLAQTYGVMKNTGRRAYSIDDISKKAASLLDPFLGNTVKPKEDLTKPGDKITNIYGGVHLKQDFSDTDPDRVWTRVQDDIERQAKVRLQGRSSDPFAPR